MGQTVNLVAYAFAGSNPAAPTLTSRKDGLQCGCEDERGRSSMVELQPSKLVVRVRFPSPALFGATSIAAVAQSVECVLGKDEVMGSSPISSFV